MAAGSKRTLRRRLRRPLRTLRGWLGRLTALVLILAAVLLTLARILLPFAGEYRAELERRIESYLGAEVTIGHLDIGWHGFGPRLQLTDLSIEGAGPVHAPVAFEQAYVTLLPAWTGDRPGLQIADISLLGLDLSARIDERGRVHALGAVFDPANLRAAGKPGAESAPGPVAALAGVFGVRRLQLLESTLTVTGPGGETGRWSNIELRLANAGERHRFSLSLTPPPGWGEQLRAQLEFSGAPADYRDWRARLFVDASGMALDAWSALWPGAPVRVDDGRLDLTLWSDWNAGRLVDAQAEVAIDNLDLARADGGGTADIERIGGRVRLWQPSPSQWQIDVGGLQVRRDGRAWPVEGLSCALEDSGGWRLATDFLRVEDVATVARLLPLEGTVLERIEGFAPRGDVHGLALAVAAGGDFHLRGDFRDLGWSAAGEVPGMTGLDGRVDLGSDGGRAALESSDVVFAAPHLFREPLRTRELSALVRVMPIEGGLVLNAPRIHVRNADVSGRGRARIELAEGESPLLDLQFDYDNGVARATSRYLPAGIMPPPVVAWLDQAFRGGRVEQGSFTLRGRTEDFPFRDHEGVFDVRFDVAGVSLNYGDGWPAIEGMDGRIHFSGPGLVIRADRGTVQGVRLQRGRAEFADLETGRLKVDVAAKGPVDGMLGVVNDSPLAPRFAPVFGGAHGSGSAELDLGLEIPVEDPEETRVDGEVRFAGSGVTQPRHDLAFDQLDGRVRFSERTVTIKGLEATLRGQPVRIDAATRDGVAYFRGTGELAPAELVPALAEGPLAGSNGRSAWNVVLRVPFTDKGTPRLEASSDLRGTRIDLPPPLGKPAAGARPLRLNLPLGTGQAREARLRYGEHTRIALEFGDGEDAGIRRLGLAFDQPVALPRTRGIRVAGRLQRLPLGSWLDRSGDDAGSGGQLPLTELDLRIGELAYGSQRLSDVHLDGQRRDDGSWRLALASNEATGNVTWPPVTSRGDAVRARFDWIDLALLRGGDTGSGAGVAQRQPADPATLPSLDLRIDRLKLADATLREFALVTGAGGGATTIHRLDFHTDHLQVDGRGQWRGGGRPLTSLRLTLRSGDFGQGLAELGYPDTMADGDGRITFDLEWSAPPWDPQLATLSGHAEVKIEDGVLLQVNPGAARLLGMFSLDAVPFRTLLQKGLIFKRMRGRIDLDNGNAYTSNLKIDSAIGVIRVRGRTGLIAKDYDQRVLIKPELSSSLPVLGFLSGGPVAAAAVALLQGVMRNLGQDVESATEVEYTVTGSWDDPKVERAGAAQAESANEAGNKVETPR